MKNTRLHSSSKPTLSCKSPMTSTSTRSPCHWGLQNLPCGCPDLRNRFYILGLSGQRPERTKSPHVEALETNQPPFPEGHNCA
jgi:hypothetical protein